MVNFGKFNRHWNADFFYGFEKKRDFFEVLLEFLDKKQIVALTGLRRTGKTVLFKQLVNFLISGRNVSRRNILYFSFDDEKPSLDELFREYRGVSAVDFENEPIFIFLDEIQKLDGWQDQIKTYYDNFENLKFFVSGSASLFVRKKASESLAGRIYTLDLPVISFKEFLVFRNKGKLAEDPKLFEGDLKQELLIYARRNFIDIVNENDESARLYLESIANKIVYEDIPSLFPVENPEKLKSLFKAIYSRPGMLVNYENLGIDLGLSSKTVERYLYYLIESRLVKKVYNYSKNFLTSEKKSKKLYVTAPCFCFLNDSFEFSQIAENMVAIDSEIKFFWRSPQKDEIDFVSNRNGMLLPIESKYSENINRNDFNGLNKFMKKNLISEGVMVTKGLDSEKTFGSGIKIKQIPLWRYALGQRL